MSAMNIIGTGHALPERIVDNNWFSERMDTSDEWITSRTGISTRHHSEGETHTELCVKAAQTAMQNAGISGADIGLCIVATMTADHLIPSAACIVGREIGVTEDTLCFDLNAACAGFLFALHTAEALLATSKKKYALVIGAEVLSRLLDFNDRNTCILFGDGAGAVVTQWREDLSPTYTQIGCRGDDKLLLVSGTNTEEPSLIKMEGTAVFKFALDVVPKCMNSVLEQAGLTTDEVDFFVFHQANARIIDLLVRKYRIPEDKYYKNIQKFGNTSAASIPIVLSELAEQGKICSGSRVLCVGFGGGLTWGGSLVTFG